MCWVDQVKWIEVSLTVTAELAEAVAEVMGRFTREGVVIEQLALADQPGEETLLSPQVRVFGYLLADSRHEEYRARLEDALFYLGRIQPLPPATYRPIKDQDWMAAWKQHYQPLMIGKRLVILPAWIQQHNPERLPIRINPGMAFGTGTHPTTQLCLELLESYLKPGERVIDIGCGSGILSIAAMRLGASSVTAVDTDPAAIASTRENSNLNQVTSQIDIQQGSLQQILSGQFGDPQAPLVVANILASVILGMLEDGLADAVEQGGKLILSGILASQAGEILNLAAECGLRHLETRLMEDWAALCLQK